MTTSNMPDEPYYTSEQIPIPPELPDILLQFSKAAIRTQPGDVLAWSAAYFRALANGETPPVKERLEMPVATQKTDTGLTMGLLKILHKQLSPKGTLPLVDIRKKFDDVNIPREQYDEIVQIGSFNVDAQWDHFLAIAVSKVAKNMTDTLIKICELLTSDPPGANARIPFEQWKKYYRYLAEIDGDIREPHIKEVIDYLANEWVIRQNGMIHPRNFIHPECPKLEG
ncbi:unnamed protein product [Rotaria socialis]|uniref:RIIa domain-containing protein n=2 Tax=Rotaria socialis TaxID=392032 RepID=A0A818JAN4_9BILA|nr:unnamed protein product [Rotaria socialis]CAF3552404.1 unnamed protein product [Rotaria socialis]CAF3733261.1 unnamed protein product [Rotaria socialis]CAF4295447.1 unnamed protein product [Rotaria socialis]CAF4548181.1 unnamed protein product [Rotaria socialis]